MEWFYTKSNNQVGPVSQEEMIRMISAGELSGNDQAWHEGVVQWQPISTFPELRANASSLAHAPGSALAQNPSLGPAKTSGLAVASLCLGIASILLCGVLLGLPAVICGHMALGKIKRSNERIEGKPMAIVGLICGYLSILASIAMILFFVFLSKASLQEYSHKSNSEKTFWDESLKAIESQQELYDKRPEPQEVQPVPDATR